MFLTVLGLLGAVIVVPVRLVHPSADPAACAATVRATSTEELAATAVVDAAGVAALQLPESGRWRISIESESCWAAPVFIEAAGGEAQTVALRTWPKGSIAASLSVPQQQSLPESVQMELRPARGDVLTTVTCPVSGGRFQCDGPATSLDLRVEAEGFAPAYFWDVQFAGGRAELSRITLQRGASLSGWLEDERGQAVAGAEVRLAPQQITPAAGRASGLAAQTMTASSNARGFFQIRAIPAGDYTVEARTSQRAAAAPHEVTIEERRELLLPAPLLLESPISVVVQVDPPLGPDRQPWSVQLGRIDRGDGVLEVVASGRATPAGSWRTEGVERGPYNVEIRGTGGSVVARLDTIIDSERSMVDVRIGEVRIAGRVRFGTEPVAGDLKFSSPAGTVRLTSGDDGAFEGWLPEEGTWNVQITPEQSLQRVRTRVDVKVPENDTRARLAIDLPVGHIEGVVVDEEGEPVAESEVLVVRGSDILANAGTAADGSFHVLGLDEGSVVLQARKGQLLSNDQPYIVSAAGTKQTVVLRAPMEIKGRLVRPSGAAVVGALVRYFRDTEMLTAVSGPSGELRLTLGAGARSTDVVVFAPRSPVVFEHVEFGRDETVIVIPDAAAVLRITPRPEGETPRIARAGARLLPVSLLFAPRQGYDPPPEITNGAIELRLAPGSYNVCFAAARDCVQVAGDAGVVTRVAAPRVEGGR